MQQLDRRLRRPLRPLRPLRLLLADRAAEERRHGVAEGAARGEARGAAAGLEGGRLVLRRASLRRDRLAERREAAAGEQPVRVRAGGLAEERAEHRRRAGRCRGDEVQLPLEGAALLRHEERAAALAELRQRLVALERPRDLLRAADRLQRAPVGLRRAGGALLRPRGALEDRVEALEHRVPVAAVRAVRAHRRQRGRAHAGAGGRAGLPAGHPAQLARDVVEAHLEAVARAALRRGEAAEERRALGVARGGEGREAGAPPRALDAPRFGRLGHDGPLRGHRHRHGRALAARGPQRRAHRREELPEVSAEARLPRRRERLERPDERRADAGGPRAVQGREGPVAAGEREEEGARGGRLRGAERLVSAGEAAEPQRRLEGREGALRRLEAVPAARLEAQGGLRRAAARGQGGRGRAGGGAAGEGERGDADLRGGDADDPQLSLLRALRGAVVLAGGAVGPRERGGEGGAGAAQAAQEGARAAGGGEAVLRHSGGEGRDAPHRVGERDGDLKVVRPGAGEEGRAEPPGRGLDGVGERLGGVGERRGGGGVRRGRRRL